MGHDRDRGASALTEYTVLVAALSLFHPTRAARATTAPSTRSRFLDATRRRSVVWRSASRRDNDKRARRPLLTSRASPAAPSQHRYQSLQR